MSRRRALMAASQPSGGDLYLTLNTTNEDNIKAFELMEREKVPTSAGDWDWFPSTTNIYVSGQAEEATFTNVRVNWGFKGKYLQDCWEIGFEGIENIGAVPVCYLWYNGTLEAFNDD